MKQSRATFPSGFCLQGREVRYNDNQQSIVCGQCFSFVAGDIKDLQIWLARAGRVKDRAPARPVYVQYVLRTGVRMRDFLTFWCGKIILYSLA